MFKKLKLLFIFLNIALSAYAQHEHQNNIYAHADSIAALYDASEIENLPILVHKLTSNITAEKEKFRALYTWVSTHIQNDYYAYERVKKSHQKFSNDTLAFLKWNSKQFSKVLKNIKKHQRASCTGYAYLIQHMAQLANIESIIVNGYGKTANTITNKNSLPNHSWNAVKLDNTWYLCDATWSAGKVVFDEGIARFQFHYNDGYFLPKPEMFAMNHYPLNRKWLLLNEPKTYLNFIEGPLIYNDAFNLDVFQLEPLKMKQTILIGEVFTIRMQSNKINQNQLDLLVYKNGTNILTNPKIDVVDNTFEISHSFLKNGLYDVHLMYDNKPLVTYVLEVEKRKEKIKRKR